jgi:hypothetical protein
MMGDLGVGPQQSLDAVAPAERQGPDAAGLQVQAPLIAQGTSWAWLPP